MTMTATVTTTHGCDYLLLDMHSAGRKLQSLSSSEQEVVCFRNANGGPQGFSTGRPAAIKPAGNPDHCVGDYK